MNRRKRNFIIGMILVVAYLTAFLISEPVESAQARPSKEYKGGWIECFQTKAGMVYCEDGRFKPDMK